MPEVEEKLPSVAIHLSHTGRIQITFKDAIAAMDDASGEAVLTIHATQIEELRDAVLQFLPLPSADV
ncbi:hypothetical protein IB276_26285 [Ensifer sp. ENS04]|uniref:hypothetical protein n=1 Tax=Ensifer sp. ENS04 TaxID=2769281 RepID=UPI001781E643|nr:hypothetical protein [Ensifer sp. ENS04]MBD9542959.1 hypothetical protein [Ensifer sp. ENS04]